MIVDMCLGNKEVVMVLAELTAGMSLRGLEPDLVCTVVATVKIAEETIQVIYRLPDGTIRERLLSKPDEATVTVADVNASVKVQRVPG